MLRQIVPGFRPRRARRPRRLRRRGRRPRRPPVAAADPADPFFDGSVLHDIFLTINSRDWASLKEHFLDNTYYPADFKWSGQTVRNIGIRSRGTGSRSGVKPGLRVDFDRYTTDQKFLGLKSFILRNNTQDPSGMRERLSMELFKRMGLRRRARGARAPLHQQHVDAPWIDGISLLRPGDQFINQLHIGHADRWACGPPASST